MVAAEARPKPDEFARRVVVHATALTTLRAESPRAFRAALADLDPESARAARRVVWGHPLLPFADVTVMLAASFVPGAVIHELLEAQFVPQRVVFGVIGLAWRLALLGVWWWFGRPTASLFVPVAIVLAGSTLWANFVV
jgi:hypothetical protein